VDNTLSLTNTAIFTCCHALNIEQPEDDIGVSQEAPRGGTEVKEEGRIADARCFHCM